MRIMMHDNQNGMILVLAMFMMALLSMIGIASMMTSTTDIEIASGEQQYVETFYRSFASHTIAGELLHTYTFDRGLKGDAENPDGTYVSYETITPDGRMVSFSEIEDDTFAFRFIDPGCLGETADSVKKTVAGHEFRVWKADEQSVDQLPCPPDMPPDACRVLDTEIGTKDFGLWTDIRLVRIDENGEEIVLADIDIDKIDTRAQAGGGAEFGSDDLGIGSSASDIFYNLDARSRLSSGIFNKSPSRQALGFRLIK